MEIDQGAAPKTAEATTPAPPTRRALEPGDFDIEALKRDAERAVKNTDPTKIMLRNIGGIADDVTAVNRFDWMAGLMKPVFGLMRTLSEAETVGGEDQGRLKSPVTTENIGDQANRQKAETGTDIDKEQADLKAKGSGSVTGTIVQEGLPYVLKSGALATVAGPGAVGYGVWLGLDALTDGLLGITIENPDNDELMRWFIGGENVDEMPPGAKRAFNGAFEAFTNVFGELAIGLGSLLKTGLADGTLADAAAELLERTKDVDQMINASALDDPENFAKFYEDRELIDMAPDLATGKKARTAAEKIQDYLDKVERKKAILAETPAADAPVEPDSSGLVGTARPGPAPLESDLRTIAAGDVDLQVDFPDDVHAELFDLGKQIAEGSTPDAAQTSRLFDQLSGFVEGVVEEKDIAQLADDYHSQIVDDLGVPNPIAPATQNLSVIDPDELLPYYISRRRGGAVAKVPDIAGLEASVQEKHGLNKLSLSIGRDRVLKLNLIEAAETGQGSGTAALTEIIEFADQHGLTMALSPEARDTTRGGAKGLRAFYKRFGFQPNTGPRRDPTISESMVRQPLEAGGKDGGS